MKTIADKVIAFNASLRYTDRLPGGFSVMNPFCENPGTIRVMEQFYRKFYDDHKARKFIIGINPGRYGAGLTGVPFTDTKKLEQACGIEMPSIRSYELSAVFIYDMIEQYGGVQQFYGNFYINSVFPLAIVQETKNGKWVNANYYDDRTLAGVVRPFMIQNLKRQIALGMRTEVAYVLGRKNAIFVDAINREEKLFGRLVTLEHPRFIQQYRSKHQQEYIEKYLEAFNGS